jgi:hypothetical protein
MQDQPKHDRLLSAESDALVNQLHRILGMLESAEADGVSPD